MDDHIGNEGALEFLSTIFFPECSGFFLADEFRASSLLVVAIALLQAEAPREQAVESLLDALEGQLVFLGAQLHGAGHLLATRVPSGQFLPALLA
ncbi:hypothetical protein BON30_09275 [Cystobacter ferrugineus]|uniref:Uncharacterized protein n=1 Tax=Cystobacter ferrugineus TaxID=83449 RepID=A0A1L9BFP0_9BACT|nr:hypothetical protein BON30_09275 [Cystobacter ferrugineus]